jgi:hypothetical protein
VTLATDGKDGPLRLLRRSLGWRFPPMWYVASFLMPFLVAFNSGLIAVWMDRRQISGGWFLFFYLLTFWILPMAVFVGNSRGSVIPAVVFHGSVNFLAFAVRHPYTYFNLL